MVEQDYGLCRVIDNYFDDFYLHQLYYQEIKTLQVSPDISTTYFGWPNGDNKVDLILGRTLFLRDIYDQNNLIVLDPKYAAFQKMYKGLEENIIGKTFLYNLQLNLQMVSMDYGIHKDDPKPNTYTLLVMVNPTYDKEDGGEFVMYDNSLNEVLRLEYVPGRIIIFESIIPHKGFPPKKINTTRYTIAFRFMPLSNYLHILNSKVDPKINYQ